MRSDIINLRSKGAIAMQKKMFLRIFINKTIHNYNVSKYCTVKQERLQSFLQRMYFRNPFRISSSTAPPDDAQRIPILWSCGVAHGYDICAKESFTHAHAHAHASLAPISKHVCAAARCERRHFRYYLGYSIK